MNAVPIPPIPTQFPKQTKPHHSYKMHCDQSDPRVKINPDTYRNILLSFLKVKYKKCQRMQDIQLRFKSIIWPELSMTFTYSGKVNNKLLKSRGSKMAELERQLRTDGAWCLSNHQLKDMQKLWNAYTWPLLRFIHFDHFEICRSWIKRMSLHKEKKAKMRCVH